MKPTGIGTVAEITKLRCLGKHCGPRHFVHMVFQCHGVSDQLKAVLQRAVMFTIEMVQTVSVGNVHQLICRAVLFTGAINFKLDPQKPPPFPIENLSGFVVVILDAFLDGRITVMAQGVVLVIVIILIVGVVPAQQCPAPGTGRVVIVIAALA